MKVFIFTDLHGDHHSQKVVEKKSKKAELIVFTGDLTVFEHNMRRLVFWLHKLGGERQVLVLHGNHESEQRLRRECSKYENLVFLHKSFFEKNNLLFAAYGGGGFSLRDLEFERFSKKIKAKMKLENNKKNEKKGVKDKNKKSKGKKRKLVLLLHGPPYGNKTDLIYGDHAGNKSYADFIKKERPFLVVCGHLHENNGVSDKIGRVLVINPGPEGRMLRI